MPFDYENRRANRGAPPGRTPAYKDGYAREPIILDSSPPVITELWNYDAPAPPVWSIEGVVRERYFSLIAAHAGSGKSFLALLLALCTALGTPIFGRSTKRSRVLYLDYEMDQDEHKRRLMRILTGLGLSVYDERLRDHFYYHRAQNPLSTPAGVAELDERVKYYDVDFIVVDSLTFALGAADASAAKDVMPVLQGLQDLGVSGIILDHFSKASAQGNHAFATPIGSTMKYAAARTVFNLTRTDGGGILLQSTKSNFGPGQASVCYEMDFEGETGPVIFREVDRADPAMAGASKHLRTHDITLVAVETIYAETGAPVTQEQVVDWRRDQDNGRREVTLGSVRNHFTDLKKAGKIVPHESDGYVPTEQPIGEEPIGEEPIGEEPIGEAETREYITVDDIFPIESAPDANDVAPATETPPFRTTPHHSKATGDESGSTEMKSLTEDQEAEGDVSGLNAGAILPVLEAPKEAMETEGSENDPTSDAGAPETPAKPRILPDPFIQKSNTEHGSSPEQSSRRAA